MSRKDRKGGWQQLTPENRRLIRQVHRYLDTHHVNEVVSEDTLTDLVGMALECQQRGDRFSDALGGDAAAFCRDIVDSAPRQSTVEWVLDMLQWIFMCAGAVVPLLYLAKWILGDLSPVECNGLWFTAPSAFVLKYCVVAFVLVFGWYLVRRNVYVSRPLAMGGYLVTTLMSYLLMDALQAWVLRRQTWNIHLLLWLGAFALLLGICWLARRLVAFEIARRQRRKQ